jgi:hypothetical protein
VGELELISRGVLSFSILSSSCSLCFDFVLFFALLLGLPLFVLLLALRFFLLLDNLIVLFWLFSLLAVLQGVLDLNFKLYVFCY